MSEDKSGEKLVLTEVFTHPCTFADRRRRHDEVLVNDLRNVRALSAKVVGNAVKVHSSNGLKDQHAGKLLKAIVDLAPAEKVGAAFKLLLNLEE